jgi:hypothetical protein
VRRGLPIGNLKRARTGGAGKLMQERNMGN